MLSGGTGHWPLVRISVIGTGYLGATHAAALASCGHEVVGVDTDPLRVALLAEGRAPFHEPGLEGLLRAGVRSGRLRFTTDCAASVDADVHFLCVSTPQRPGSHAADLSMLESAVHSLLPFLRRPALVVGKSTVPVGTARRLAATITAAAPAGEAVGMAWNPEFLREGHAVEDSLHPDRLVFGVRRDEDDQVLRDVYAPMINEGVPVVRTDLETAELAKVSANAMLATRVSLVNLLAEVCEAADADVADLTRILGLDERIGAHYLNPGVGFGGGCLPKDTRAFVARAEEMGVAGPATPSSSARATNARVSFGRQPPPNPTPGLRNLDPMRSSRPRIRVRSATSASAASQTSASRLTSDTRVASIALADTLASSAVSRSVRTTGTPSAIIGA